MKKQDRTHKFSAIRQPMPVDRIQKLADHGKTDQHLANAGDLPIEVLEKEIPATDLHDM